MPSILIFTSPKQLDIFILGIFQSRNSRIFYFSNYVRRNSLTYFSLTNFCNEKHLAIWLPRVYPILQVHIWLIYLVRTVTIPRLRREIVRFFLLFELHDDYDQILILLLLWKEKVKGSIVSPYKWLQIIMHSVFVWWNNTHFNLFTKIQFLNIGTSETKTGSGLEIV
jgi:hypothetical protein